MRLLASTVLRRPAQLFLIFCCYKIKKLMKLMWGPNMLFSRLDYMILTGNKESPEG